MDILSDTPLLSPTRRALMLGALAAALPLGRPRAAPSIPLEVWKGPQCGCCKDWIKHLEANGFVVQAVHDVGNADVRQQVGIPLNYGSCHTARVQGYAIEGHVPAREIHRLLKEKPLAVGLAVPAMPVGSPGMDGPAYNGRKDPFDVLLVRKDGSVAVYQAYR